MGEVIYINPKLERFYQELEQQVRETLTMVGDEQNAAWVVSKIRKLLEMPELQFSFKIVFPDGVSGQEAQAINDQYSQAFYEFAENLKCGVVREFLETYVERRRNPS